MHTSSLACLCMHEDDRRMSHAVREWLPNNFPSSVALTLGCTNKITSQLVRLKRGMKGVQKGSKSKLYYQNRNDHESNISFFQHACDTIDASKVEYRINSASNIEQVLAATTTRHQLYGRLPSITKTIQVRRTRHCRSLLEKQGRAHK